MKKPRYYSLFEKMDGKWVRISMREVPLAVAVRAFQNQLLAFAFDQVKNERRLRVVKHIPDMDVRQE